ncbi:hypothetical protein KIPB_000500, partial [Kipferlia bialata]
LKGDVDEVADPSADDEWSDSVSAVFGDDPEIEGPEGEREREGEEEEDAADAEERLFVESSTSVAAPATLDGLDGLDGGISTPLPGMHDVPVHSEVGHALGVSFFNRAQRVLRLVGAYSPFFPLDVFGAAFDASVVMVNRILPSLLSAVPPLPVQNELLHYLSKVCPSLFDSCLSPLVESEQDGDTPFWMGAIPPEWPRGPFTRGFGLPMVEETREEEAEYITPEVLLIATRYVLLGAASLSAVGIASSAPLSPPCQFPSYLCPSPPTALPRDILGAGHDAFAQCIKDKQTAMDLFADGCMSAEYGLALSMEARKWIVHACTIEAGRKL